MPSPRRDEAGISSLEVIGTMLVVGTVIGAIAFTVNGKRTSEQMSQAFCGITGGQACGPGSDGSAESAAATTERCVGAPAGAAGPVRGSVPVPGSGTTDADKPDAADAAEDAGESGRPGPSGSSALTVAVMGDGTYQVSRAAPALGAGTSENAAASPSWVDDAFGTASAGAETFLRSGGSSEVYTVGSTAALAEVLAADREEAWSGAVVGDDGPLARLAGAAFGVTDSVEQSEPDAVFTDLSTRIGLSLNAYEQTLALDAGGEAVGLLTRDDGSTTEYVGVRERTEGVDRADDVVPMLLQLDRDPSGNLLAVRTVTDREITADGVAAPSGDLFVTHLDVAAGSTAAGDLAASIGSTAVPGAETSETGSATVSFVDAGTAFRDAAVIGGYVTRQRPAGTVDTADPNADPVEAGLAQVMRAPAPQIWNGATWTERRTGCS
ncbi:MAG: hypothetical protein ACRCSN_22245 [Dermatophilaceae bacterium]